MTKDADARTYGCERIRKLRGEPSPRLGSRVRTASPAPDCLGKIKKLKAALWGRLALSAQSMEVEQVFRAIVSSHSTAS